MTTVPLPRRTLLQSGALLAGPLAVAGFWPRPGYAAPVAAEAAGPPMSGTLVGWVVVEPDRGASIRLVQLDAKARPIRQVAAANVSAGASLDQFGQRAHAMAVEAVARSWGVPAAECVADRGRIVHAGQRREIACALWTDVV